VQVAALSNQARAEAIAKQLGGTAQRGGALLRIRLGPFSSRIDAERARDAAVRRGYGDAAIIVQP
jgi:rare lipoprotein A